MSESKEYQLKGLGLSSILTIIFVVAKLFGVITWSWWWVFAPVWIGLLFAVAILVLVLGIALVGLAVAD